MNRFLCFFLGHKPNITGYSIRHLINAHIHYTFGTKGYCVRCHSTWFDEGDKDLEI